MGRITLSLRGTVASRIELANVTPDRVAHLDARAIAAEPLRIGRQTARVGDVFDVRGGHSDEVVIEGALQRVDGIGSGMRGGRLIVEGDAGAFVGALMSGGLIDARGGVGAEAGIGMSGGTLRVRRDAGDRLGANLPGAAQGMTGGEIVVSGRAGREVGARCRRGLIVVAGSVGPETGRAMVAGTIVVSGAIGACPGRGNRRGSIVALAEVDVPATYRYACTYDVPYLRLLFRYLSREYGFECASPPGAISRFRRYCGDAGQPGKGEFLVRDP